MAQNPLATEVAPKPLLGHSKKATARLLGDEEVDAMIAEALGEETDEDEEDDDAGSE